MTRLRLLAHLPDARRPKCRNGILAGSFERARLTQDAVDRLDAVDARLRTEALKQGHSKPIAVGKATTADGKTVGHVSR